MDSRLGSEEEPDVFSSSIVAAHEYEYRDDSQQ